MQSPSWCSLPLSIYLNVWCLLLSSSATEKTSVPCVSLVLINHCALSIILWRWNPKILLNTSAVCKVVPQKSLTNCIVQIMHFTSHGNVWNELCEQVMGILYSSEFRCCRLLMLYLTHLSWIVLVDAQLYCQWKAKPVSVASLQNPGAK